MVGWRRVPSDACESEWVMVSDVFLLVMPGMVKLRVSEIAHGLSRAVERFLFARDCFL